MAATPVVKVFLMLVARRKDSWETPSRPAMDPDSTVAPAARLVNNELMSFLQAMHCFKPEVSNSPVPTSPHTSCDAYFWESCNRRAALVDAGFGLA